MGPHQQRLWQIEENSARRLVFSRGFPPGIRLNKASAQAKKKDWVLGGVTPGKQQ